MKKLIVLGALLFSAALQAQTYQYEFQKEVNLPGRGMSNRIMAPLGEDGWITASSVEDLGGNEQQSILITLMDTDYNVTEMLECEVPDSTGLGTGFKPTDICQSGRGSFVICGSIIQEGHDQGGFLLRISDQGKYGLVTDWMKIYPYTPTNVAIDGVLSLTRVVETASGFMMIGRSTTNPVRAIIVGTDHEGNVMWSRRMYDDQYGGNENSALNDMVAINEEHVAVVGTVNMFPVDDADIMIVVMDHEGNVINESVYEKWGEGKEEFTYKEYGKAIIFDRDRDELIVTGMVDKKWRGVCTHAEYRRLFVMNVSASSLTLNWQHQYEADADLDLNFEGLSCSDIAYDPLSSTYAVTGSVVNEVFNKTNSVNSFILRIDATGGLITQGLRYYGTSTGQESLYKIYPTVESGTYVAAGTKGSGPNRMWLVESYMNVSDFCDHTYGELFRPYYPLVELSGIVKGTKVESAEVDVHLAIPYFSELIVCEKIPMGKSLNTEEIETTSSKVYPSVTADFVTVESSMNTDYNVISLSTGANLVHGRINAGKETVDLLELPAGIYLIRLKSGQSQQVFKIVKQ